MVYSRAILEDLVNRDIEFNQLANGLAKDIDNPHLRTKLADILGAPEAAIKYAHPVHIRDTCDTGVAVKDRNLAAYVSLNYNYVTGGLETSKLYSLALEILPPRHTGINEHDKIVDLHKKLSEASEIMESENLEEMRGKAKELIKSEESWYIKHFEEYAQHDPRYLKHMFSGYIHKYQTKLRVALSKGVMKDGKRVLELDRSKIHAYTSGNLSKASEGEKINFYKYVGITACKQR